MTDNEIIEYLKQNEENTVRLRTVAMLLVVKHILIENDLTTEEFFDELTNEIEQKLREKQVEITTPEERKQVELFIKFMNIFGGKQ